MASLSPATVVSTFFGVGFFPIAPGTIASLVALPPAWLLLAYFGPLALASASGGVYFAGVISTAIYARATGKHDPSECVIDEVAGQWLACSMAPLSLLGFAAAFVLFRVLDITKLWPVSAGEKLAGGWGIMTDDVIAGAIAGALVAAARWPGLI